MRNQYRLAIAVAMVLLVVLARPAAAQLQVGDNVTMKLNGNLSFGYTGDYSNVAGSDHGMTPGGNADLTGSYYDPRFLSFEVQPFYNQSRLNSTYQSVFQTTGVNGTAAIFSGSHFPGSVSYAKNYNSEGGYTVPGVGNLTTRGNSDNLALVWGIRVPDYPNLSFQFADGNNTSSVFGSNGDTTFHSKTFGVVASDTLAGFNLTGGYHRNTVHAVTPEFLTGEGPQASDNLSNTYDLNVGRKLPLYGALSAGVSRSDIDSEAAGSTFKGTIDTASSGVDFEPVRNLNLGASTQYTNNLEGTIYQPVISAGGIVPSSLLNYSTHSLDLNGHANYALQRLHLTFGFNADHRVQEVLGVSLSANTLEETVSYGNDFLGGFVNAVAGVTQTTLNVAGGSNARGQFENLSYTRNVQKWRLSGSVNYARNTQTVLIGYTSSGHGYSAGIGRKLGTYSYWSANAIGTKSTFSNASGADNFTQSYSTSLSLKRFSVSGSYSKADGTSILTPTGLTPISSPTPILTPLEAIIFNGKSYSFGASTTPRSGLVLSASYSKTNSNTVSAAVSSLNDTMQLNTMLQYKVRQLWITGGYLKLRQGFSVTGLPPSSYSSFFIGVTRWFNFF